MLAAFGLTLSMIKLFLKIGCRTLTALGILFYLMRLEQCETEEYDYRAYYSRYTSTEQIGTMPVDFAIAVPNSYYYHPRPMPLVVALHYGGTVTDSSGLWILAELVLPAWGELEAIFVAPVSPALTNWTSSACEKAIFGLLDTIQSNMQIDPKKIIITGYSMGGTGTWYYVNKYPTYFAVAVPISGSLEGLNLSNLGATPIYAIHSQADTVISYATVKERIEALQSLGLNVQLKSVKSYGHYEVTKFVKPLKDLLPWIKQQLHLSKF